MVISLWIRYLTDTGSLEEISSYGSSWYSPFLIKLDLNKFTETTEVIAARTKLVELQKIATNNINQDDHVKKYLLPWIIVSDSLRISKCFKNRIGLSYKYDMCYSVKQEQSGHSNTSFGLGI